MLGFPKRLTLRSQILALTLAVGLPAIGGVAWALAMVLDSEREAVNVRVRSTSVQVANNLKLLLGEHETLLITLASLTAGQDRGTDLCVALASEWGRLPADRAALALHGIDGQRLCGTGPSLLALPPPPGSDWFQQGLSSTGMTVGTVVPVTGGGGWTAPLTYPLLDVTGRPVGLLVLPLNLRALQQQVMPAAASTALVTVIDGNDALLMRSVDVAQWQGQPPPPGLAVMARGLRDGVLSGVGLDGRRRLFAFAGVADTPWRVVVGVDEEQVLARYQTLLHRSVAAGLLGLLGTLVLAWRLGNRIVRPISALAATSARVAGGDVSARAEIAGPAEIEAVAAQFNLMLDAGKADRQALSASEAQLRFLIDHLVAGVVVHAPDGRVLLANAQAAALTGMSLEQITGQDAGPGWRFLREDGTPLALADLPQRRVINTLRPVVGFVSAIERSPGGPRTWLIVSAYPQLHDDGRLRQVVVSFIDITARKQAEQTLVASEARYRMLFENSLDGVLQTGPDGSVLAANPAACAIFGLDEAALRARGRAGLADPSDPRLAVLLARRNALGHAQGRLTLQRGDGSRFEAELTSTTYTGVAGEALSSVVVRDVSRQLADEQARARLELQLRESQKMEAIGTLAGGIAHDFNNILGGLLGNAALAADPLAEDHPARAHLQQVQRAGQRARSLVQQILAFSRRQTQPEALQRHALRPLVEDTLALLRATLPAGVQLVEVAADEPIEIDCDATQIQQVLMNLCTNAWHALEGRPGRIGLRLDRVHFDPQDPARPDSLPAGPWAHLQVSDDGSGMDDATRARIFEPFFTTKPVGQGPGLGLAVVHGIVAAHQGEIVVHSRPGEGSCFDVYLPLADADGAAAPAGAPVAVPAGQGQQVLVVDDDEVMLLMVRQLLARAGYRVSTLGRVDEALAALRDDASAFDLVVTDFNMPDGSGLDVARAALRQRPDRPVVLSSGYLTDGQRAEALALGVRAVLMKAHTLEELPALLGRLLAAPARLPPAAAP
jgi:PAS domain S-box-containing protein